MTNLDEILVKAAEATLAADHAVSEAAQASIATALAYGAAMTAAKAAEATETTVRAAARAAAKLPKTADGVIVVSGMEIWYWISDTILASCNLHTFHTRATLTKMDGWLKFHHCYSTEAAARAAAEAVRAAARAAAKG